MPLAAKEGDKIVAFDTHLIQPPGTSPPLPVPMHPFNGIIDGSLSGDVSIEGRAAATVDSTATNTPSHLPLGGKFVIEPKNQGQIVRGSMTVTINGKRAARLGDTARTCNDPVDLPVGTVVVAAGTVSIGG
jgi:uncharacterized Zn-binding protein involved in type VI secretion